MVLSSEPSMMRVPSCQKPSSTSTLLLSSTKSKTESGTLQVSPSQLVTPSKLPSLSSSPTASGTSPLCPSSQGTSIIYRRFKIPEVDALTSAPAKEEEKEEKKEEKKDVKKEKEAPKPEPPKEEPEEEMDMGGLFD